MSPKVWRSADPGFAHGPPAHPGPARPVGKPWTADCRLRSVVSQTGGRATPIYCPPPRHCIAMPCRAVGSGFGALSRKGPRRGAVVPGGPRGRCRSPQINVFRGAFVQTRRRDDVRVHSPLLCSRGGWPVAGWTFDNHVAHPPSASARPPSPTKRPTPAGLHGEVDGAQVGQVPGILLVPPAPLRYRPETDTAEVIVCMFDRSRNAPIGQQAGRGTAARRSAFRSGGDAR